MKVGLYKKLKNSIKIVKSLKASLFFFKGKGGNVIILLFLNFYIISL
jgi:hypothetical protein